MIGKPASANSRRSSAYRIRKRKPMAAELHFDGFYHTGPAPWEDWHAGVRMHAIRFHYLRFYPNGDWLLCYRDHEFDFWEFTETIAQEVVERAKRDSAPRMADADPLCIAGSYKVDDGNITTLFAPDWTGGMTWEMCYRIRQDHLISGAPGDQQTVWSFQESSTGKKPTRDTFS